MQKPKENTSRLELVSTYVVHSEGWLTWIEYVVWYINRQIKFSTKGTGKKLIEQQLSQWNVNTIDYFIVRKKSTDEQLSINFTDLISSMVFETPETPKKENSHSQRQKRYFWARDQASN